LREAQTKIADLQGVNVSLLDKVRIAEESAGKAKSDVEIKYTTAGALNAVQFDVAAEQQSKQRDILKSLVDGRYEIKTEGDKIIAVDRTTGKKAVNDATLEPLSLEGVFIAVAKEYGLPVKSPAADGRGSGSSSAATGIAAMTEVEFNEHLRKINKWGTIEGDKLYKEWKEAHKTN
jgi:hypothetical protein